MQVNVIYSDVSHAIKGVMLQRGCDAQTELSLRNNGKTERKYCYDNTEYKWQN